MSITTYDDNFINKKVEQYQNTRYKSDAHGVYENEEDIRAEEEYDNGFEQGRDEGFFDGYLQCLKDLGIRK